MSDTLEVEHAGHKIRYQENENRWRCWDLDIDAPQLAAVKAKINAFYAAERKLIPTDAIHWHEHSGPAVISIVMIAGDKKRASYERADKAVWAIDKDGNRGKYTADGCLFTMTEIAKVGMAEYKELQKQSSALHAKMKAIRATLVPLDVAALPRQDQQP